MTMIATTENHGIPIILGDLLISSKTKLKEFILPSLSEDIMDYLSDDSSLHPIYLAQKIYILKENICIAFTGSLQIFKQFLEDIVIFCRVHENVDAVKVQDFLINYKLTATHEELSFCIYIAELEGDHIKMSRLFHGNWLKTTSSIFGEVMTSGSGAGDFVNETQQNNSLILSHTKGTAGYALQTNIILLCKMLAAERATLSTVKKHWGAGFEMVYLSKDKFLKMDNIAYIINHSDFDENGNIGIPIPAIILYYKYYEDILTVTVIRPFKGETKKMEEEYIISYKEFKVSQFVIVPINNPIEEEELPSLGNDTSFTSYVNAMGYVIETEGGKFLPASLSIGEDLKIEYKHLESVTITMKHYINDTVAAEAKRMFPVL